MLSRAWMEVDLGALVRNATALGQRAGVPLIPMVKANAYGLGAEQVAHALEQLSPAAYGVATVEEGRELRSAGIDRDIIVFTPLLSDELDDAHSLRLTPTLGFPAEIAKWKKYGAPYVLSIDTGMARAGLPWRDVDSVRQVVAANPPAAAFTHFHSPELDDGSMEVQLERFEAVLQMLPVVPAILHTDSSAAIVRHSRCAHQAVRPGIFLYGVGSGETAAVQPEPVVTVKSRIVELRTVEPGDTVSYDATWTAVRPSVIATIPMGYADGYPRNASNEGYGVVAGKTARIAGRVTMDMIMLDVTGIDPGVGDVVTMIGDPVATGAPVDIASIASFAGMSPYELLTGLRGRLQRTYRGE
jgi:alanine racemase